MSTPNPVPQTSTAWYNSTIIRSILVAVVSQLLAHSKLANTLSNDQVGAIVNYALEGISAASAYWAMHARVTQPVLPISGTKLAKATDAAIANSAAPTPVMVPVPVPVLITSGENDAKATPVDPAH